MRYRQLSPTGDYMFGSGQKNFLINSPEAVAQKVVTVFRLWLGEWFLNTDDGTPYLQGILNKHSQDEADTTFQSQIATIEEVIGVIDFSSSIDPLTRKYSVSFKLNTIYGVTTVQNLNYGNI